MYVSFTPTTVKMGEGSITFGLVGSSVMLHTKKIFFFYLSCTDKTCFNAKFSFCKNKILFP